MKQAMTLNQAVLVVECVRDELWNACERIEIAGSIRRGEPEVGDIELLAIPRRISLFEGLEWEHTDSKLDQECEIQIARGNFARGARQGPKHKQFLVCWEGGEVSLDLFIVERSTWPVLMAIRTGPKSFSQALVCCRDKGGRLPDGHYVQDGRVWRQARFHERGPDDAPLEFADEREFLRFAGGWVAPEDRR